jgi:serine protease AprX
VRKLFGLVVVALLAAALPATASQLVHAKASAPTVAPSLERTLTAAGDTPLVVFVHGRNLTAARRAVAAAGLDKLGEWTSIDVVVAGGTPAKVRSVIGRPGVTYVEPNTPIAFDTDTARVATRTIEAQQRTWPKSTTTATPTDKRCSRAKPSKKGCTNSSTSTTVSQVGPFTGAGRSIAIVDSGIDGTHPMFQRPDGTSKVVRNMKLACLDHTPVYFNVPDVGEVPPPLCAALDPDVQDSLWVDFTSTTNDTDTISGGGHGTHVASIAAGEPVTAMGRQLGGTAPDADLIGLSIGATLSIYGADTALDWIARHHDKPCGDDVPAAACPPITVVNNSYGPTGGGEFDPEGATTKLQRVLVSEGIAMIWANGNGDELNDGGNGSDNRSNPPGQDPTPGIISVANYDDANQGTREGAIDSTSSRGQAGRPETYPDVSAPGTNITAACRPYLAICSSQEEDPNYGTIGGTSMSTPHVAGIVATMQQAMEAAGQTPEPGVIEDILEDTAHKFTFGAPYEADPRNTDNTSSFDKGHGLVDTYNALSSVFALAPTEPAGGTACDPASTGFTDPEGDATRVASPDVEQAYDPRLDLIGLTVNGDPTAETIGFTFGFAEVDGSDPSGAPGMSADLTFSIGADAHTANIARSAAEGLTSGTIDSTDATVVVDEDADTISITAPRAALGNVGGPVTLSGLHLFIRRDSGAVVAPVADEAGAPCPVTVNVGGTVAPPPDPDPTTYAAELARGGTYSWEGTPPVPVNPAPSGDTECATDADPRCDTTGLWLHFTGGAATVRITTTFADGDDFDVHLFGPDGSLIASAAATDNPEVLTAVLPASGVYRVAVTAALSTGGGYSATATLT